MKYFLFDWDGCIADSLVLWLDAYREELGKFKIFTTDEKIISGIFVRGSGPKDNFGIENPEEFHANARERVFENMNKMKINPNAFETIKILKDKGNRIGIVSSNHKREIVEEAIKREKENLNMFDTIVMGGEVKNYKPNPEQLYLALERLGFQDVNNKNLIKNSVVMIGDSEHDIGAGKNAGTITVLYHSEANKKFYSKKELSNHRPDYIIEDFKELLELTN